MNNQNKSNNLLPVVIIGLVLVVAVAGGWWLYSSNVANKGAGGGGNAANRTQNRGSENYAEIYSKGAPGANPPHTLGAPNATVTVEEFADYQCPTCAAKFPVAKEIANLYGSRIKFIYRNYPLTAIHDKAYDAAVAAEAAGLQGEDKFWAMQNQLFTNQSSWSASTNFRGVLDEYAQKIGLDVEKFKTDMAGLAAKNRVDADMQRAKSLRVTGTPSFFVNGRPVDLSQMTIEGFKQIIDAELQKTQQ